MLKQRAQSTLIKSISGHVVIYFSERISSFLGSSVFRTLGRLSYGVYLIHYAVIMMNQGLLKTKGVQSDQFLVVRTSSECESGFELFK